MITVEVNKKRRVGMELHMQGVGLTETVDGFPLVTVDSSQKIPMVDVNFRDSIVVMPTGSIGIIAQYSATRDSSDNADFTYLDGKFGPFIAFSTLGAQVSSATLIDPPAQADIYIRWCAIDGAGVLTDVSPASHKKFDTTGYNRVRLQVNVTTIGATPEVGQISLQFWNADEPFSDCPVQVLDLMEYTTLGALNAVWPETNTITGATRTWSIDNTTVTAGISSVKLVVTGAPGTDNDCYREMLRTGLPANTLITFIADVWINEEVNGSLGTAIGIEVGGNYAGTSLDPKLGADRAYIEANGAVGKWTQLRATGMTDGTGSILLRFGFFHSGLALKWSTDLESYADTAALLAAWPETDPSGNAIWTLDGTHVLSGTKAAKLALHGAVTAGDQNILTGTATGLRPGFSYQEHINIYPTGDTGLIPNQWNLFVSPILRIADGSGIVSDIKIGSVALGTTTVNYDAWHDDIKLYEVVDRTIYFDNFRITIGCFPDAAGTVTLPPGDPGTPPPIGPPPPPTGGGVGIPFGAYNSWNGTKLESIGTSYFDMTLDYISPGNVVANINTARAAHKRMILVMTGGSHSLYMTNGVFDRNKWNARQILFNTPEIKRAIAAAVLDGTVLGCDIMDEPNVSGGEFGAGNTWGPPGTMTKAKLDSMAAFVKNIFPTIPVGVSLRFDKLEPTKDFTVMDFIVNQYTFSYGSVTSFRDNSAAFGTRSRIRIVYSLNLINGGELLGATGCPIPRTGGMGTYGTRCRITSDQLKTWGLTLGVAGAGLAMWQYDLAFMQKQSNQAAFRDIAVELAGHTTPDWRRY